MQLVDTNVLSELVRQAPNKGVLRWLESCQSNHPTLNISVITIDEITFGISRRPSARLMNWLDSLIQLHNIVPVTEAIARRAGEIRAQFESKGLIRTQADMLIAATAQLQGFTLVTRNINDFDGCGITILNPFSQT
jgi:toxin FitB